MDLNQRPILVPAEGHSSTYIYLFSASVYPSFNTSLPIVHVLTVPLLSSPLDLRISELWTNRIWGTCAPGTESPPPKLRLGEDLGGGSGGGVPPTPRRRLLYNGDAFATLGLFCRLAKVGAWIRVFRVRALPSLIVLCFHALCYFISACLSESE